MSIQLSLRITALAAGIAALSVNAGAQSLIPTQGIVVASSNDVIPDTTGAPIVGLTFFTGIAFDAPVVDDAGNVFFRGRLQGTPVPNTWDDRAYFYGTSRSNLKMVLRAADQTPGLPAGVLLRSSLGSSATISSGYKITNTGTVLWGGGFWDQPGTNGITSANDEALFGGSLSGSQALLVQQGAQLPPPAAVGTTYAQAFSGFNATAYGYGASGHIYFVGTTVGGDTIGAATLNNATGIWSGLPGALAQVARKNNAADGLAGEFTIDTSVGSISGVQQMNTSGKLLYELNLSTTQGTPVALPATDKAIMVYTQGVGSTKLVRESDVAPGTSGATFQAITGAAVENWAPTFNGNAWTRSDKTAFISTLRGGDVSGTTNDVGVFMGGVSTLSLAVRKGGAAPGTDANFLSFANVTPNDAGRICFSAALSGGTSTTANDSGIWSGLPGSLQLVVREGQTMPGTGGSISGAISTNNNAAIHFNDTNRVVFTTTLAGGTIIGASWWAWSPVSGLKALILNGDSIEVQPTVFKTATGAVSSFNVNNSDGAPIYWTNTGELTTMLTLSDASRVIVRLSLPFETPTTSFCLGDGTGAACPCANTGATGHGCGSGAFPSGAILSSAGFAGASAGTDTLVLTATNLPGPGLFFQATGLTPAANFGDGLMCASVGIIRLGVVFSTAGVASYPGGNTPNPIHIAGLTTNGDTRHYQCWYRSNPSICTPLDHYDTTQGLTLTWGN